MNNMNKLLEESQKRIDIQNVIYGNIDLFAEFLFLKKGFFHRFYSIIELKKHKSDKSFSRLMLALRFQHLSKQKVSLDFLKFLSSIYTKDMMEFCVYQNKDITYADLGFSNTVLSSIYIHYIENRKRLLKGDIRNKSMLIEMEKSRDAKLKALVDNLYD